ncbi:unnamed protein product [Rotaria sp. Silwood2]|nr:unnamed protein product [Rotaria sp. Silwood2]CAF3968960.1 unnamed protein product [Rotaria sp. Silwood2]
MLSSLLFPVCAQILLDQNNIQSKYISSQGLSGRVIPAGTFPTKVLALEYLYGLQCSLPNLPPRPYAIKKVDLIRIAYDSKYLITQNEIIVYLSGNKRLTVFTIMAFDKAYKLCGYEGHIRNFGLTFDPSTDVERQLIIGLICTAAQTFCNGILQQYSSVDDCTQYLMTKVPYGSYDRGDQGTVACRAIHAYFVPLLPSVHCPHVGPTGGGACTDKTIDFYYNQPNFLGCACEQE